MTTSSSQFLSLRIGSNDAFPTTASFNYNLAPEHEWLPFEPFSSIIREIGSSSNLQLLIDNLKAPARIRTIFLNWLCSSDYKEPEPAHPDQYIFEQSVIPKTLITLLNSILQENSLTVTITNAQFLSNSACRLIEGLSDHKQANIQLALWTPLDAFNRWWPDSEGQRILKQRFKTSALQSEPAIWASPPHSVQSEYSTNTLQWADRLYCGEELDELASTQPEDSPDNEFAKMTFRLLGKTYKNAKEEAFILITALQQFEWEQIDNNLVTKAYLAIYKAYIWHKHTADAYLVAQKFLDWSQLSEDRNVELKANILKLWAACLTGNFEYDEDKISQIESKLRAIDWNEYLHLMASSYWFDSNVTMDDSLKFLENCHKGIAHANQSHNALSKATYYHHSSIIEQNLGRQSAAIANLEKSISLSQEIGISERIYNGLNSKAYLLAYAGLLDEATQAVLYAFPMVITDENYEQICTTLCNVAVTLLFAGDFRSTATIIEDILNILLIRGIPNTRHRTTFELRAIESICYFLQGNGDLGLHTYHSFPRQTAQSTEGKYAVLLMDILSDNEGFESIEDKIESIFLALGNENQPAILELFIRRSIHGILKSKSHISNSTYLKDELAILCASRLPGVSTLNWLNPTGFSKAVESLPKEVQSFNLVSMARKASQIEFIKFENLLLRLIINLQTHAASCTEVSALFDFCLKHLNRIENIVTVSISVEFDDTTQYRKSLGKGEKISHDMTHQYEFQFNKGTGILELRFSENADIFGREANLWCEKIAETLSALSSNIGNLKETVGLAYLDHLTGAKNRASLDKLSEQYDLDSIRSFVIAYIDIDNFKHANDQYGHQRGDQILISLVKEAKLLLSSSDSIYRLGGDEFLLFMPDCDEHRAKLFAGKFLERFAMNSRRTSESKTNSRELGCSIGLLSITSYNHVENPITDFLPICDNLMYNAKNKGKNQHFSQTVSHSEANLILQSL